MLSFAVNTIAPPELIPVPEIVIGSATVIPPEILSAAPLATVVAPSVVPRPVAFEIAIFPAVIDVAPV